jgi:hypothetical protein
MSAEVGLTNFQHTNDNNNLAETETASTRNQSSQTPTTNQPSEPTSAATQVFAITELLEQILLFVEDIPSLMTKRRVAPQWRVVIDDTTSLKQKMWLAPQQLDHEWYLSPGADFLRKRPILTGRSAAAADSEDVVYKSGLTNPFLFEKSLSPRAAQPIWSSHFHNSWVSPPLLLREGVKFRVREAKSLFLQMFATQPPVKLMYLRIRSADSMLGSYRSLIEQVKNAKGVRVGDVLRAVSRLSESHKMAFVVDEMMFDVDRACAYIDAQPYTFRQYGYEL